MMINLKTIFEGFTVDGVAIPVSFMYYNGHGGTYITYQLTDEDGSFSGDDELLGYAVYYDIDIYSKTDYTRIISEVKTLLKANGLMYQPMRSSGDMYETDTKYYHRTLCFKALKEEI